MTADCGVLADALGWTSGGGWPSPPTPQKVIDDCGSGPPWVGSSTFPISEETTVYIPSARDTGYTGACECLSPNSGWDPDCCTYDASEACSGEIIDILVAESCPHQCNPNCTDPSEAWTVESQDDCEGDQTTPARFGVAPGADKILHIDPASSYIFIQTPSDFQTFPVSGGGSARTSTDQFMTATLYADDGELDGDDFLDWWWWTTAPIDYDPMSGDFTVYEAGSRSFRGSGYRDAVGHIVEVRMGANATGSIHPVTGTWELDYSETAFGWTVEIHLEGELEDP